MELQVCTALVMADAKPGFHVHTASTAATEPSALYQNVPESLPFYSLEQRTCRFQLPGNLCLALSVING